MPHVLKLLNTYKEEFMSKQESSKKGTFIHLEKKKKNPCIMQMNTLVVFSESYMHIDILERESKLCQQSCIFFLKIEFQPSKF